tara:strand:+ start:405 stop:590 length:186 start_codon:yes stop_codon:yes gene_type:complete
MANVTIDGKEYDYDTLSDKAKATLSSIQFVQSELKRISAQASVLKTAESAYGKTLKQELEN